MNDPDYFTLADTAEILDISTKRVAALVEAGMLTARPVGPRAIGITKTDVMALRLVLMAGGAR